MSRGEFSQLCLGAGFVNKLCGDRESDYAYGISQHTNVNELDTDVTLQMCYINFLEALARIAHKSSMARFGSEEEATIEERKT